LLGAGRERARVPLAAAANRAPRAAATVAAKTPSWIETALALAAIAALLPLFERLAADDTGRDERFADAAVAVGGLHERVLPGLCAAYGGGAEPLVRERLCRRGEYRRDAVRVDALPLPLVDAFAATGRAFQRPLADAARRRNELRLQQREGLGDLRELGDAIAAIDEDLEPYVAHYALTTDAGVPLPLGCAFEMARTAFARPGAVAERGESAPANLVLLLGAALDGSGATAALAANALLPRVAPAVLPGCAGMAMPDALGAASTLLAEARQARVEGAKNEAMRDLLRTAGWQWAAWMLAGLALLKLSRRPRFAFVGVALALVTWALAAWIGRVPWPFSVDRAFVPAREAGAFLAWPAPFVVVLLGAAALALIASRWRDRRMPSSAQTLGSRAGYAGLVVASGVGFLVLLDLSANGNAANRYLALYHQGHLWFAMLALSVIAFLRQVLGRTLGRALSLVEAGAAWARRASGTWLVVLVALASMLGIVAAVGVLLGNVPQLTSELGRVWLVVGAAWFFFLRGDPLAERLARSGNSLGSLARYLGPLLFVAATLIGVQLVTKDMGPLLIAIYAAGAFVAAAVAMWWQQRRGGRLSAFALAAALFATWILAATVGLFELGALHDVTAGRLENLAAPLASANDQLALVAWFQHAAPPTGFGVGAVPWCGYAAAGGCPGVPAQIQSDYTMTALVGMFGWTAAWAIAIGGAVWLHRLIRHHGRVTRGEPRLVRAGGRVRNDDQALLSWLAVGFVVLALCQLAVTVAGNLAVLPLTGVTFPFVSFGLTSLVVNMALLGLALNVDLPAVSDD
jgi:cell division protein FtsW (lipid II flippase)